MKIVNKKIVPYKGKVHDLTVEISHTYNVEGKAVHNSAAGSLVAYALKITQINPIQWDLQFERFMTKNQKDNGFPDIDHDVSDPMKLKDILIDAWGDNVVVPISNWNTLQLRSLIKDVGKFYGVPFTETNAVTNKMLYEATPKAKAAHGIKAGLYVPTFKEVMEYSDSLQTFLAKYPHIETHVTRLHGSIKSASRHAGGIVIAENLDEWMPLINSKGVRQTPWSEGMNVKHLEPSGFIKFDLLGLASLRMMEVAITHILKRHYDIKEPTFAQVKEFYDTKLHPDNLDLNDQDVYTNIFHEGRWAGVFQFTNDGAQKLCSKAKPTNIVDISAITSIYRPGPMSANVHVDYIKAKNDPKSVEYPNRYYQAETEETFGFLIFQEQIAKIAHRIGQDLSLDEGNKLRKVIIKRDAASKKLTEKLHKKFSDGAAKKGILPSDANDLWEKFEFFSGYGFNKSLHFSELVSIYDVEGNFVGDKPIKEVVPGDYVRSRDEATKEDIFVAVKENHNHGKLKLIEFELDTGERVKCTMNHKFRVRDGRMLPLWKILEEDLDIVVSAEKK